MKFEGSIEFSIIEGADDRVVSEMPIRAGVKNPFGVVHVGAILWLADVTATVRVMGPGVRVSEGMKGFPLAITLNANFIGNQTDGIFPAVSSFVKRGHTREGVTKITFTILKCCDCRRPREWRRTLLIVMRRLEEWVKLEQFRWLLVYVTHFSRQQGSVCARCRLNGTVIRSYNQPIKIL